MCKKVYGGYVCVYDWWRYERICYGKILILYVVDSVPVLDGCCKMDGFPGVTWKFGTVGMLWNIWRAREDLVIERKKHWG